MGVLTRLECYPFQQPTKERGYAATYAATLYCTHIRIELRSGLDHGNVCCCENSSTNATEGGLLCSSTRTTLDIWCHSLPDHVPKTKYL